MNLEIFKNNGVQIRGGLIDGEPWFVAKDVCSALGYSNTSKAISDHVDEDDRYNESLERGGTILMINESGLYSLILRSNKPEAKKFKRWVTHEVLPDIRKHGGYLTPEKVEETIREQKPLVSFAKTVEASVDSVLIGTYAKLLSDAEGVKIGQNRLFEHLRENGYLITGGTRHNVPYQKYIDNGWFEVTTQTFAGSTGAHQKFTTKITGKGQIALAQKIVEAFRKEEAAQTTERLSVLRLLRRFVGRPAGPPVEPSAHDLLEFV